MCQRHNVHDQFEPLIIAGCFSKDLNTASKYNNAMYGTRIPANALVPAVIVLTREFTYVQAI